MANQIITRDILTIDRGIIVHQVNCRGVMGAGLAKKIADKWPVVKEEYLAVCRGERFGDDYPEKPGLGDYFVLEVAPSLHVASLFGQDGYGQVPKLVYTNYWALANGFREVADVASYRNLSVYLPHGIGCGLAGGDWHVVSALIEQELPDAVICRWPG